MDHPFFVAFIAYGVAVAYDMLYHCFNADERTEIEAAFASKGVYILYDKLYQSRKFYVKMNQGALFSLPLLMQSFILKKRSAIYAQMHQWTIDFVNDFADGPWDVEGVFGEGPGYGSGTVQEYCEILPALAACLGKTVEEVIPRSLSHVMEFHPACSFDMATKTSPVSQPERWQRWWLGLVVPH